MQSTLKAPAISHPLLIIILAADLLILSFLAFLPPITVIGLLILSFILLWFVISPLGYLYFLVIWIPYEGFVLPEDGTIRVLRLIVLISILLLAWFKYLLTHGKITLPPKPVFLPLVVFYIWTGLSIIWAVSPSMSLLTYSKMLTYLAIFLLIYNLIKSSKDLKRLLYFILLSLLPIFAISVYQAFAMDIYRAYGTVSSANTLGIFCINGIGAGLFLLAIEAESSIKRWLIRAFMFLSSIILILTLSRASILDAGFLLFFLLILRRKARTLVLLASAIILFILYLLIATDIIEQIIEYLRLSSGTTGRVLIWEYGLQLVKDNLFLGVGIGGVPALLSSYVPSTHPLVNIFLVEAVELGYIHNGFIQKAAELGLPGLIILIWIIVVFAKYLASGLKQGNNRSVFLISSAALALFLARMSHSMFESLITIGPLSLNILTMMLFTGCLKYLVLNKNDQSQD